MSMESVELSRTKCFCARHVILTTDKINGLYELVEASETELKEAGCQITDPAAVVVLDPMLSDRLDKHTHLLLGKWGEAQEAVRSAHEAAGRSGNIEDVCDRRCVQVSEKKPAVLHSLEVL